MSEDAVSTLSGSAGASSAPQTTSTAVVPARAEEGRHAPGAQAALARELSRGLGGALTFSDVALLGRTLGWAPEDAEDCWYDIVRGVPAAATRDWRRAAEYISGYSFVCGTAAHTAAGVACLLEVRAREAAARGEAAPGAHDASEASDHSPHGKLISGASPDALLRQRRRESRASDGESPPAVSCSTPSSGVSVSVSPETVRAPSHHRPATEVGGIDSPRRPSPAPHQPPYAAGSPEVDQGESCIPRQQTSRQTQPPAQHQRCHQYNDTGKETLSTPTATSTRPGTKADSGSHRTSSVSSAAPAALAAVPSPHARQQRKARPSVLERFALPTESSRRRFQHSEGTPPAPAVPAAAAATSSARNAVNPPEPRVSDRKIFDRLYADAAAQRLKKARAAAEREAAAAAALTFVPQVNARPSHGGAALLTAAETDATTADTAAAGGGAPQYNRPTRASLAKLTGDNGRPRDAIAEAPATARVCFQPPPGPSPCVPAGYVEGVARLRRSLVERQTAGLSNAELRSGDSGRREEAAAALLAAPILRLPVDDRGRCVDVRLGDPDNYTLHTYAARQRERRAAREARRIEALQRHRATTQKQHKGGEGLRHRDPNSSAALIASALEETDELLAAAHLKAAQEDEHSGEEEESSGADDTSSESAQSESSDASEETDTEEETVVE